MMMPRVPAGPKPQSDSERLATISAAGDRHAAPEVESGEAAASEASDVFSLAGIVFETLEDTRVNAASARALLGASGRNRPIHDKPLANRLGADLAAAIALARDPDRAARPRAALILDAIEVPLCGVAFSVVLTHIPEISFLCPFCMYLW